MPDYQHKIWVFLVERGLEAGSDVQLFWNETDAIRAVRAHLIRSKPDALLSTVDLVYEAIEATNQEPGRDEYVLLASFPVLGTPTNTSS